ncbi:MAG: TatD family hydrolase [Thermodesulfobacteriota bacterium]|nr:TatD family hydrolase [Thermodesulfobacteriota bacterium]
MSQGLRKTVIPGLTLIDSHAHLDMQDFEEDRKEILDRAVKGGLTHIISVGIDIDSSISAIELAREYDFVYAAVGFHPHNAHGQDPDGLEKLARMTSDSRVVAWGEIGLDFYRCYSSPDEQMKMFSRQLELADDLGLPVIIHDREAHEDILSILKRMGKGERKGVIHCFSGDSDLAMTMIELGYYISIPGTVTYKKATRVKEVASSIPMQSMLIETDAPFLAPVPKRGKRNEPLFVSFVAQEIACLRNIQFEEVARRTSENAKILFGLT